MLLEICNSRICWPCFPFCNYERMSMFISAGENSILLLTNLSNAARVEMHLLLQIELLLSKGTLHLSARYDLHPNLIFL